MGKKIVGRFIIEIAGKPIENVNKALNFVLDELKKQTDKFKIIEAHIGEPELDDKTTLFAGFLELELKFKEPKDALNFIFDYTPTSVEIVEPDKIDFDLNDFNGFLNDISAYMLTSQSKIRNLSAQIQMLKKQNR